MKIGNHSEDFNVEGEPNSSRREFLAAGLAAGAVGAVPALTARHASAAAVGRNFLLTNILLETGYAHEGGEVIGTLTELSAILVQGGKIARIMTSDEPAPVGVAVMDGEGMLLLPTLEERAGKQMVLLQGNGTTYARSHCNVDPVIGTKYVELLKHALDQYADTFSYEIVGFPQHGFFSADLIPTVRRALEMGAAHIDRVDSILPPEWRSWTCRSPQRFPLAAA